VLAVFAEQGLAHVVHRLGAPRTDDRIAFATGTEQVLSADRVDWLRGWWQTTFHMAALRDNPACAQAEYDAVLSPDDPGISPHLTFDPAVNVASGLTGRPRVAILREQGVNGQIEMAAAFHRAGFEAVDVHMSQILDGSVTLGSFKGLAACGGFSYGDTLGAGGGWAKSILFQPRAADEFAAFFSRSDTFSLGVCNGCQMLSVLKELIPGAQAWPRFVRNLSEQFEARVATIELLDSPSILFAGMAGSRIPVATAHGEGRALFAGDDAQRLSDAGLVAGRFVDNHGLATEAYPLNPNGSPGGLTMVPTPDGRVTAMMPHPERCYRTVANSYTPDQWGDDGPWLRMFRNARVWVG